MERPHGPHIWPRQGWASAPIADDDRLTTTGWSQWLTLADLSDTDEDEKFLKEGWIEASEYLETYVESQDRDWIARQVWGFAMVESGGKSVKKYVRRAIIRKKNGSEVKRARLVYDYKEPLRN
jgi:hypothetical protein